MRISFVIAALFLVTSCNSDAVNYYKKEACNAEHRLWDELLHKHVDSLGMVSYTGFIQDSLQLIEYLHLLNEKPPCDDSEESVRIAFWINSYNAFTVYKIINNYPLKSITELHPTPYIPMVNTVWHQEEFKINDQNIALDHIEHGILRKEFNEPRIHFAINCASYSCPSLRREAYFSDRLDEQLEDQAIRFVNDSTKNKLARDQIQISRIFNWFSGDFTDTTTLSGYINRYSKVALEDDVQIGYMPYNWSLNEQTK